MEEQNSAGIIPSSKSTIVEPSYDNPVIQYDYAFNTDLLRSGAIQQESSNKLAKETSDDSTIQGLNPSVFHQHSPSGTAVKYVDICNPECLTTQRKS